MALASVSFERKRPWSGYDASWLLSPAVRLSALRSFLHALCLACISASYLRDCRKSLAQVSQQHAHEYCRRLEYTHTNLRFVEGHIEDLTQSGIVDNSVDLIISNCVINLCPNKALVFKEAYRVLKPGGEMFFSDMYATRRLSLEVRDQVRLRARAR